MATRKPKPRKKFPPNKGKKPGSSSKKAPAKGKSKNLPPWLKKKG